MADEIIRIDTSILIDFYRKKSKEKSAFFLLTTKYKLFAVSIVTQYEIMIGTDATQIEFWSTFFDRVTVLPFDKAANDAAITNNKAFKECQQTYRDSGYIYRRDSTSNNMPIATLNKKHFERIPGLTVIGDELTT